MTGVDLECFPDGRYSDGKLWTELIAERLGAELQTYAYGGG